METNDLKAMWKSISFENKENSYFSEENLKKILENKRSNIFSEMITGAKKEFFVNLASLLIYLGLMIYAYIYLGLSLSFYTNILFCSVAVYLLSQSLMIWFKYKLIKTENHHLTLKEAFHAFRNRLIHLNIFHFSTMIIFFFLLAFFAITAYLTEVGGLKNIPNNWLTLQIIIALVLLTGIPWFVKYVTGRWLKKLFKNLENTMEDFSSAG